MLISDMKALRLLQTHKQIFLQSNPTKTPNSLSIISRQNLQCSRHFHSSLRRLLPEASGAEPDSGDTGNDNNDPQVWSFYRPRLGTAVTRTSGAKSGEGEPEPMVDNLSDTDKTKTEFSGSNGGSEDLSINRKILGNVGNDGLGLMRNGDAEKDAIDGKKYDRVKKVYSSNRVGVENAIGRNNKKKKKTSWVCTDCGHTEAQWWGYCRACGMNGAMKEFSEMASEIGTAKLSGMQVSENVTRSWLPQQPGEAQPLRLADLNQGMNQLDWRIPLFGSFGNEVARVLGGGLVPGSLILVGGDPGVGKSTLLLQIAAIISEGQDLGGPSRVIYVSGEESVDQIGNRAHRLNIQAEELYLYSSTDIEDMLDKSQRMSPRALIVDSIQTVYLKGVAGSAGGISQVKECTSALLRFAKLTQIPVFLIGHVTKSGDIAGPRLLEHIVDVVLYMEGEKYSSHRLLRPVKNRFGSTDELGVFEMSPSGLQAVSNPSEIFLNKQYSDSKILAGLAIAVVMDGSRSFLIEIQALCVSDPSGSGSGSRHVNGIQASRADMIISVLMKQASLMLQPNAVFLNVVSGVTLTETAGDLAIAAAICSSFLEFPIPNNVAFIGEIDLAGQIRMVPRIEKRVHTLEKLGYKTCIVPKTAVDLLINLGFEEIEIIGCNNLKEVINTVFEPRK